MQIISEASTKPDDIPKRLSTMLSAAVIALSQNTSTKTTLVNESTEIDFSVA